MTDKPEIPHTFYHEIDAQDLRRAVESIFDDGIRKDYRVINIAPLPDTGRGCEFVVKFTRRIKGVDDMPVTSRDRWRLLKEHLLSRGGDSTESVPAIKMRKSVLAWMDQLEEEGKIT